MTEERRKEIQEIRQAHKRLAEIITAGTEYHEPVTVKTTDGAEHVVDVYALSEKDLVVAFEEAGQDLKDIGDREKLITNLKLMGTLAARATHQADIVQFLIPLQSAPIAIKALEISGLTGGEKSPKAE